ncbi:Gfo/Idh/MocA family protein [Nocardioides currus]|uniref:Oxidoreductase n=1 Tax=Nocardioides currus TaxID=2133958 RepID=A0A2R7YZZ1_9ACTN|nr:Gfo/Idh/MocA family oxidoreductase [Nocardioides currus]PUA81931.1 oxidoreductase [Nocardioides currus]
MTTKWAVAGTGSIAETFAEDFVHVEDAEIVAIGSRSTERAGEFGARFGGAQGYTYDDLMGAPVDVVYIATPHPQHHALARAAIEAGKAVLVEKSFTASLADTRDVVDLARERGVFCMEAMWTRFQPAVVEAKRIVDSGELGDLVAVQADLGAFRTYDPASRLFAPELGGGAVLDLGVYVVSIAQQFLGTPDAVTATGTRYPNGVDASAMIHLAYDDGRAASLACALTTETPGRAVIWGTKGSIELGPRFHHPHHLVVRRNGAGEETIELPPGCHGLALEAAEVNRCLAAGLTESPTMPLADTVDVQRVMEETLAQISR